MKDFKNQVVFVQLKKRTIVHEIKTAAKYNSPEWKVAEAESQKMAEILDDTEIKFALSSDLGRFTIMVSENDSTEAIRLLERA